MSRWLTLVLLTLLLVLQYRLWVGDGSLADVTRLKHEINQLEIANDEQRQRNAILAGEVQVLKSGLQGIEERAREDLGMIKAGETFYMLIDPPAESR